MYDFKAVDIALIEPGLAVMNFIAGGAGRFRKAEGGAVVRDVAGLEVGRRVWRILRLREQDEEAKRGEKAAAQY
ncbi:MAG: hypothetical protein OXG23_03860 [Chloroflexi bacterium]|nr:hypothetical protein [Chloroflexota bacterium]